MMFNPWLGVRANKRRLARRKSQQHRAIGPRSIGEASSPEHHLIGKMRSTLRYLPVAGG
jgi:hypothetical protein